MKALTQMKIDVLWLENPEALSLFLLDGSEERLPSNFRPGVWAWRRVDGDGYPIFPIFLGETEGAAERFLEDHRSSLELARFYGNDRLPGLMPTGWGR